MTRATFGKGVHLPGNHVYLVTNKKNGKQYVGATTATVAKRWSGHVAARFTGRAPLHKAILKDGPESFHVEKLRTCGPGEGFAEAERRFIAKLNTTHPNGYNGAKRRPLADDVRKFIHASGMSFDDFIDSIVRKSRAFKSWQLKKTT